MNECSAIVDGGSTLVSRLSRLQLDRKTHIALGKYAASRVFRRSLAQTPPSRIVQSLIRRSVPTNESLEQTLIQSNEILASATTVFPFTLFPDTIVLDRTKLTVITRSFFWSEDVMSIRIEDILNVSVTLGPIFGSITVATRVLSSDDHFTIRRFWREDALHLKHMIQGYVIARHNDLETAHLSKNELKQTLRELGYEANRFHHEHKYFKTKSSIDESITLRT